MSVTLSIAVNSARQADAGTVLAAAQRGDAAAQAELFDRHRLRVARQVLRMTGPGADHPVMTDCPESAYLKCMWCRVW